MWECVRGIVASNERSYTTVTMSDELLERIEERLDYGDSRSAWIREAVEQRLERETTGS